MSDSRLYDQTKTSLGAISSNLRKGLRQDLDVLRAAVDERIEAVEATIGQTDALFERVVQDICEVAAADAEHAATQARLQAEQMMQRELDAARAQAQEEIATLRAEFDATRATLEAQLTKGEAARAETATALTDAQQELAAARRAWEEQAVSLDEAHRRIRALEEDHTQWTLAGQVAEAHLEQERQRRKTIAIQLEATHEELRLAKAETTLSRLEAHQAAERIQKLEAAQTPLECAAQTQAVVDRDHGGAMLDHLREGLQALSNAQTPVEILTTLLESLSQHFPTAALFAVGPHGFKLWRSRSADPGTDFDVLLPLASESPLARAFRERTLAMGDATSGDGALPRGDRQVGQVAALPLVANERVIAVAYVENPQDRPECDVTVFTKMAEILIDRVNQRLQRARSLPPNPPSDGSLTMEQTKTGLAVTDSLHYRLARQVRRLPINENVKVLIDGVASALVDLSTLGAQIVSPNVLRPNRAVRIALPRNEGPLSCKARIVWARAERVAEGESMLYRAGLEFTEADVPAVQAFVTQYGVLDLQPAPTLDH